VKEITEMIMNIHYSNTAPTPWIESMLRDGFEEVSQRLGGVLVQHLRVLFEVVNSRTKPGKDLYRVKIFGYSANVGRFEIQKTASAPDELIAVVLRTAKSVLGKRKFFHSHTRRRLVLAPGHSY
jgi:hypothetical protein